MHRRQYLAASVGVAGASLTGCTALADETELGPPTERRDGESTQFGYERDGEEVVVVYFNRHRESATLRRLRVLVEQSGDTTLDDYRFRFNPDTEGERSARVYLHPPRTGNRDEFDTYRDGDWTVVAVPEYGSGGRVTTGFEVVVHDADGGVPPVEVDYEITVSGNGYLADTFAVRDRATIEFERG